MQACRTYDRESRHAHTRSYRTSRLMQASISCYILVVMLTSVIASTKCPPHCIECRSDGICIKCKDAYFIDAKSECAACQDGCLVCQSNTVCGICAGGYAIMFGTCEPCADSRCLFCRNNPNVCSKCARGFILSSEDTCEYQWHSYLAIIMLALISVLFLAAGICCIRSYNPPADDTDFEDEEEQLFRKMETEVNFAQRKFSDLLPESVKANEDRGIYVSIMENIGADSIFEKSNMDNLLQKDKESFFSKSESHQLDQDFIQSSYQPLSKTPTFDISIPASHT